MATVTLAPDEVVRRVASPLTGLPACIAGSAVAAEVYGMTLTNKSDVDVFCYSSESLIAGAQRLLNSGFTLNERFVRVWDRWLKFGFNHWHTNSIKFEGPRSLDYLEVNLVHKLIGGNPLNSLAAVLESFDFGLLGVGYDLVSGRPIKRDMRSYLFPHLPVDGPLPLMPNKRDAWRQGLISQYNGLREVGRYAKYAQYGYDLSLVKDDLAAGYMAAATYLNGCDKPEKQQLGKIYEVCAIKIQLDEIDDLAEAGKQLLTMDSLDQIMEALE